MKNLRIAMVTGGLPFAGDTLEKKSLGGSETAFIYMARELAKLGHLVHAFVNCPDPDVYDNVGYYHISQFRELANQLPYDVLISSRWPEFLRQEQYAACRILWCHDTLVDPNRFMGGLYQADWVYLLSDFHIQDYESKVSEIRSFCKQTKNGVDLDLIAKCRKVDKNPNQLIYTSRPERGLHYLLSDIFPRILETNPDTLLYFCSYELTGMKLPEDKQNLYNACMEMAKRYPKNIAPLGSLTKEELYKMMANSAAWIYPTDFPEISCISALEAQACGTAIVTTNDFALSETVGSQSGYLIRGTPLQQNYIDLFCNSVRAILDSPRLQRTLGEAGVEHVLKNGYTWSEIAKSWNEDIQNFFSDRERRCSEQIDQQLLRYGSAVAIETFLPLPLCEEKFEKPTSSDSAVAVMAKSKQRFQMCLQMLGELENKPISLLDYGCGYSSFGLVAAKQDPNLRVVLADADASALNQAAITSRKLQLHNVEAHLCTSYQALRLDTKFDVIFLGDILEHAPSPSALLNSLAANLTEDGVFLITSEIGPLHEKPELPKKTDRIWNLTYRELRSMFDDRDTFLYAHLHESENSLGESLGHSICMVSPKVANQTQHFPKLNIKRIRKLTRPYQSISVCVIASENEDCVGRMLKSVAPIADEIILVDTRPKGSTDVTPSIAASFGASVIQAEFDNFAQVRNISRDAATKAWVLWIDTDEQLVGASEIRKYLTGSIYNGFALKQMHLTVDNLNGSFDMPIRLFRNLPQYRFTGLIHEHCEDISKGEFDNPIAPRMFLPDATIAHYGYMTEAVRKHKCSNRNMKLLQRCIEEQPERMLTWVLVIRDYLNMLKWDVEAVGVEAQFSRDGRAVSLLTAAIDTFNSKFPYKSVKYYDIVFPMYQEALMLLGKLGVPYKNNSHPPFQVFFALAGGVGGFDSAVPDAQSIWFLDFSEYQKFMQAKTVELGASLGVVKRIEETTDLTADIYGELPNASALIKSGIGIV